MDKPWANPDFVKWQLAEQWLHPEDWWWNTIVVPVSAQSWFGIDTLLDMIILTTQLQELKADTKRLAVATVIESRLDAKLWSLATVLINTGTLNKWDAIVCNSAFWRVRSIKDFKWKNIESAWPSKPVLISWLNSVVEWWDILQVTSDIEIARSKAHEFNLLQASKSINDFEWASLEMLLNRIKSWNLKQLKIVLKADSNWSLEAVKEALLKLSTGEIKVQIIHNWVWDVNDSDVLMAGTSQALLVAYNVWTVWQAKNILMNSKIEYINKKVIYHILEKIEAIITWMIDIKHEDLDLWQAKIKAIFFTTKDKMILW
jgi:translation initiation factor IF-2